MCIPRSGAYGASEGDRMKDGVCNAVFVGRISQMCEHSRTLEHLCFQFIWEQAQVSSLERCPYFRGSFVHISM